jgi:alkanesulfonate monooxygenase SsuD/methylene tetrahydromethanopterin reductase-like flavin-dependent oxidoreductase (luciferase family)
MRIGVFCTYENPARDYKQCFDDQTRLILHAEALGFEEAWVAEHHFNPDAASPSILVLLAYLAGVTTRIRLGSAAVLLPFRNPIQVAEDVATIDVLSNGRFDFGVAKGGPFDLQNRHFNASKDVSREMTIEALELVNRLLYEDTVSFCGAHYRAVGVALTPKPLQKPIPTWIATATPDAVEYAARNGFGIMAASPFPLARVAQSVDAYRQAAPGADPRLALARFYYAAPTRQQALDEAVPFIRRFSERMRGIFLANGPGPAAAFDPAEMLERSLIGSYDDVIEKIIAIDRRVNIGSLLLKPTTADETKALRSLDDFATIIRPRIAEALPASKPLEIAS